MRPPKPLPEPFTTGPFTIGDARDVGITPKRLRASDLRSPFHTVRIPAAAVDDVVSRAQSYGQKMSPDQFFSHTTAAALLGMRMPEGLRERSTSMIWWSWAMGWFAGSARWRHWTSSPLQSKGTPGGADTENSFRLTR